MQRSAIIVMCLLLVVFSLSIADSVFLVESVDARCRDCDRLMEHVSSFENLNGRLERYRCQCGRTGQMATPVNGSPVWSEYGPEDKARPE